MFKRSLALFLTCCILFLSGCDFLSFTLSEPEQVLEFQPEKYANEFKDQWQYNTLSDEGKKCYGILYTAIKDAEKQNAAITFLNEQNKQESCPGVRVIFPFTMTADQVNFLFETFFRDNPQFFYLSRTYHLEGYSSTDATEVYDTLLVQFSLSLEERLVAIQKVENVCKNILAKMPASDDDYEKELYLHDQLMDLCVYDKDYANNPSDHLYTAYGALIEGKAVCEGYAKAMHLLLRKANIPATVVTGHSLDSGESHMWNLIRINGNTYYLDPTWNDSDTYVQHTYFNLTSDMISSSHKLDEDQVVVTSCTATKDNYFIRNDAYINTYERQIIAQAIAKQLLNGQTVIQLKFAEGKFTNGQLFLRNRTLLQQMVNPYLQEKGLSLWNYQLWSEEEQQVLTLVKE